ncbi:hypothetical protein NQZ68_013984 [Dissostichus eleginoides]|nr:hypothetical protein NQZ68_013984 [Dissostichus eleginoides]
MDSAKGNHYPHKERSPQRMACGGGHYGSALSLEMTWVTDDIRKSHSRRQSLPNFGTATRSRQCNTPTGEGSSASSHLLVWLAEHADTRREADVEMLSVLLNLVMDRLTLSQSSVERESSSKDRVLHPWSDRWC